MYIELYDRSRSKTLDLISILAEIKVEIELFRDAKSQRFLFREHSYRRISFYFQNKTLLINEVAHILLLE